MMTAWGLTPSEVTAIHSVFSRYSEISKVIIYGSRAMGTYKNSSDIDLTLDGESLELTHMQRIATELDDVMLPYKIDLSLLGKIQNPAFLDHIQRVGQVFYERA